MPERKIKILEKNLLILASAGSGKTYQLGNRVIGLVAMGVEPEKIVALTFTRKAAGEFADSVLTKLANAAMDDRTAGRLRTDLGLPEADFRDALERVVRALPRFTLGTMDSFFSKVVRGFQYELGLSGGKFDLLEGPRAKAAGEELLAQILGETLEAGGGEDFMHAFRRATQGKEPQGVMKDLEDFVTTWQNRYRTSAGIAWGPEFLAGVRLEDWEEHKHALAARIARGLDGVDYPRKDSRPALEKILLALEEHTIGSGSLGGTSPLLASIMASAARDAGPFTLQHYKEFILPGPAGEALREMVRLAARCEMAAALVRTRAIREVVSHYDGLREQNLRRRGLLGFDDVKILMGQWALGEDARLRREAVDFRLDARYEHWLLDEFQDTSRADFTGLVPLLDEAAGEGEGSLFIVGDRKQAIYAWRGGEVGLFDEVGEKYRHGDLRTETMAESRRSCPEVLALVNRVCGDAATLRELFGESATRWTWEDHFSADTLTGETACGEARVEVVEGGKEATTERIGVLLEELGVGSRPMTCGILVRSNQRVREIADDLRSRGFDVIEEGQREPAKDNPLGVALWQLLEWLADPANGFARGVVEMSPLAGALRRRYGEPWQQVWEGALKEVSESGFAAMVGNVIAASDAVRSDFSRRRAGDLVTALATLDSQGGVTARQAADWIARLEVSQSPGVAAVQVMTIHKSKGLGFDVVLLPDVPGDSTPATQRFEIAEGPGWMTSTPPKWARDLIPEIREAEARWGADQRYQDFCMLYVALTRAKRGLYVLLDPPSKSQVADHPSLANWLARSVESNGQPGIVFQAGSPEWVETLPRSVTAKIPTPVPELVPGVPRRERTTPSGVKPPPGAAMLRSSAGMIFGNEVHAAFERVGWVDESMPGLPATDAGRRVANCLAVPALRRLFERAGRDIRLLREQPIEAIVDDRWLSGIIDRLHLHRGTDGQVTLVEVIDFKTDAVKTMADLAGKYAGQMAAYRVALEMAYPGARVECLLLSTSCLDFIHL